MEALAVDGSTLPALKDLFPEHFYEHPEHAMNPPQSGTMLPQLPDAFSQSPHLRRQQNFDAQRPDTQIEYPNDVQNGVYVQQFPTVQTDNGGDGRGGKRQFDGAQTYAPSHPQPEDPYLYSMTPSGPVHPFPQTTDVHLHLPTAMRNREGKGDEDDDDDDRDGAEDGEKRKHPCPQCGKRFNRPSSLKIHLNTHTGVKPYICPFQGCGRSFNVSSNMRRHFRNHSRRPPPPPLPHNIVSPATSSGPSGQVEQGGGGPYVQKDFGHQHDFFPPRPSYQQLGDPPDYPTQLYPPSSNVRDGKNVQEQSHGTLITPPYTNEGSDHGQEDLSQRNMFPHARPHNSYSDSGYLALNPMFGNSQLETQQGFPAIQMSMNLPRGPGMAASPILPVDPALSIGHDGNDRDADGEVDADGEIDPEAENADIRRGAGASEGRRFGPSISNARGSSDVHSDTDPSQQRLPKTSGANSMLQITIPVPESSVDGSMVPPSNGYVQPQDRMQYRQLEVSVPEDIARDPMQIGNFVQSYQARYPQHAQQYQHQQRQLFVPNIVNEMHRVGQPQHQMPLYPAHESSSYNMPPEPYHDQQRAQAQATLQSINTDGMGMPYQPPSLSAATQSQSNARSTREAERQESSGGHVNGFSFTRGETSIAGVTPGAAPAPPYELLSRERAEHTAREPVDRKSSKTASRRNTRKKEEGEDIIGDEDEDKKSIGSVSDDDDDDEYTERPSAKKGKTVKGVGRTRGRPKGGGKSSGRGRGRPRKTTIVAADTNATIAHTPEEDSMEVGGKALRKRRRVSTR